MKRINLTMAFLILVLSFPVMSFGGVQEKRKIGRGDIPLPIKEAFNRAWPKAKIKECEVETTANRVVYYLDAERDDREIEAVYQLEITLLEEQEDIDLKEVPAAVLEAVKAAYPTGHIEEVEKITRQGTLFGYEVELKDGKQNLELRLDPAGKILERKDD
ncbi:MAG: PepSY-like domain-containing protein [Acidobacteria bacterium]|nr:PepSY-like domain-containing protein [Acidobacteriota bacterium]